MARGSWKWWALAGLGGVLAIRRARAVPLRERVALVTGGSRELEAPSKWSPSRLTALGDRAAARNNELPWRH